MPSKTRIVLFAVAAAMALPVPHHAQSSASAAEPLRRDRAGAREASEGGPIGVQEPSWSPDGKRIAVSYLDRLWSMTPDGKQPKAVTTPEGMTIER